MKALRGWRLHALGALLATGYVALLLGTAPDLGMARDESFYVTAAEHYAPWWQLLATRPSEALTQTAIERHWSYNHEHPGLLKSLFALSHLAQTHWHIFKHDSSAHRFPGMLSAGLLLWLLFVFGNALMGWQAGLVAALSFALVPRVFYHSHLNCFDVPITLLLLWCAYCYWRSLKERRYVVWLGVAFGCALSSKHNSWILPGIFTIHHLWRAWWRRCHRRPTADDAAPRPSRTDLRPWWLLSMLTLGPLIFVLTWPWLWFEPWEHLRWYVRFHLQHDYYNIAYWGKTHFAPPFPWHYPVVMTAFTVPGMTLLLAFVGFVARWPALWRSLGWRWPRWLWACDQRPVRLRAWRRVSRPVRTLPQAADPRAFDVLWLGMTVAPILLIALPSTPIFGGTKHWFPAYPFLCLYAAYGWRQAVVWAQASGSLPWPRLLCALSAALLLLPSALQTAHSHPFALSQYTPLAGGVAGGADKGMHRQYWGFTTRSLTAWLDRHLPPGSRVWTSDTTWGAWTMLQRDGHLRADLVQAPSMVDADVILVHHERHFFAEEVQAWALLQQVHPAHVLTHQGVPIVSVYARASALRRH
ncbi:MAG: ArnT family glycosyltransferase [Polyangiales bacterium]